MILKVLICAYLLILLLGTIGTFSIFRIDKGDALLLLPYFILTLLVEIFTGLIPYILPSSNALFTGIYNIFFPISNLLLVLIFLRLFSLKKYKRIMVISSVVIAMISLFFYPFGDVAGQIAVRFQLIYCILFVFGSLLVFLNFIETPSLKPITQSFAFWFSIAMLLWSVFLVFRIGAMYYFGSYALDFLKNLQYIHTSINIVAYSLMFYGILCVRRYGMSYSVKQ